MHNEQEVMDQFFERLEAAVTPMFEGPGLDYEVICVDDGSTDDTLDCLRRHRDRNPAIKILTLTRNFGKDTALSAGLDHATGDAVVPIDADLQDPPELIPKLFAKWLEGFEVVYAVRASRDVDTAAKRLTASWFYRLYNRLSDIDIPHDTGDYRLMDRRVVDALKLMPERNRFMKGLFAWVGFRQTGVEYERETRADGTTKWRYWGLWNFALDGITSSTTIPLRIWTYIGVSIFMFACAYAGFLVVRTMIFGVDVPGYASIMVAVLFMGGINLLTMGVIGEYLGRTYMEVKGRPLYLVRDSEGFSDEPTRYRQQKDQTWTEQSISASPNSRASTGGS